MLQNVLNSIRTKLDFSSLEAILSSLFTYCTEHSTSYMQVYCRQSSVQTDGLYEYMCVSEVLVYATQGRSIEFIQKLHGHADMFKHVINSN